LQQRSFTEWLLSIASAKVVRPLPGLRSN